MEKGLNIAAILKDKRKNTKLYSTLYSDVYFKKVCSYCDYHILVAHHGSEAYFQKDGRVHKDGEVCLFPSKKMRDWSKFAWKKGDVLVSNDGGTEVIFDKWYGDTYTSFYGKHCLDSKNENNIKYFKGFVCTTERYFIESKDAAQTYINTIEKRLGGKLNMGTLEIEKAEFKDGDIVYTESDAFHYPAIHILNINGDTKRYYARLVNNGRYDEAIDYDIPAFDDDDPNRRLRLATKEEKKQLFSALEKEGKAWDAEKKRIVELKPKIELKPFDKVLIRDFKDQAWQVSLFGYKDANNYYCCNGSCWNQCIPYEGNESLLGTTKDVEG